jgi:hypothetical protein
MKCLLPWQMKGAGETSLHLTGKTKGFFWKLEAI